MSVDILLTEDGDIDLTNKTMTLTTNAGQVLRQELLITLRGLRGEWQFNVNAFLPWLSNEHNPIELLGKDSRQGLVDAYIKEAIYEKPNTASIVRYTSNFNKSSRVMNVEFEVEAIDGTTTGLVTFAI